jgi:hypothetical protein
MRRGPFLSITVIRLHPSLIFGFMSRNPVPQLNKSDLEQLELAITAEQKKQSAITIFPKSHVENKFAAVNIMSKLPKIVIMSGPNKMNLQGHLRVRKIRNQVRI